MRTVWEMITFPFKAAARLVLLLALPAAITALVWWIAGTDTPVFAVVAVVCGLWALALVRVWRLQVKGRLRSLSRGSIRLTGSSRR